MDDHLLRFKKNLKYIIFDFETCNLNLLQDNDPWQLSFSVCEGKEVVQEYDLFPFWPDLKMGKGAADITRFNYFDYKKKSSDARECLEAFERYMFDKEYLLVGHNVLGFDVYIHQLFRKKLGLPKNYSYLDRIIDTNLLSKAYKLQMAPDHSNLLAWQYRINSIIQKGLKSSLGVMAKEFDIEYDKSKAHDGSYDCKVNKDLFIKLINTIDI